jgi:hypothetical protein
MPDLVRVFQSRLRGGWGREAPDILVPQACTHGGEDGGKALCAYLLENTTWEFGQLNAKRAVRCLDDSGRRKGMTELSQAPQSVDSLRAF